MDKKLMRSTSDEMIGGVCAGIANYLDIDPTIVRVVFALVALANGAGVLAYIVLWVIMPPEGAEEGVAAQETIRTGTEEITQKAHQVSESVKEAAEKHRVDAAPIAAVLLLVVGLYFLLRNFGIPWLWWLKFEVLWPIVLIGLGALLLLRGTKGR